MKTNELKQRLQKTVDNMIDVYYGDDTFADKVINTTLKVLVKTNMDKLDSVFCLFEDKEGNIDTTTIINAYADNLTEDGVQFDIRDYIKNDFLRNILPDKYLIINKNDILKIISDTR